jgi:putative membrane protein insertion efficiency factor
MSPLSKVMLFLIRAYQAASAGRLSPCRFQPTCSSYAAEAIEAHGPRRGAWLAVKRLFRCRPGGGRGFDPVPVETP